MNSKIAEVSATLLFVQGVVKCYLTVYTDTGHRRHIITMEYYVPDYTIHILGILRYRKDHAGKGCSFLLDEDGCYFKFLPYAGGGTIYFNYSGTDYIPRTTDFTQNFIKSMESGQIFIFLDNSNANLTLPQKLLLKLHFYLGHFNLVWIYNIARNKIVSVVDFDVTEVTSRIQFENAWLMKFLKLQERLREPLSNMFVIRRMYY